MKLITASPPTHQRAPRLAAAVLLAGLAACSTSAPSPSESPPEPIPAADSIDLGGATAAEAPPAAASSGGMPSDEAQARYALAAAYSTAHSGRALLIVHGDEVVFEQGQNGHPAGEPSPLHSASESFWGLLAAAADADGLLDLEEPAAFTLPEFAADPRKSEIRIRQLLNFTSGLESGVRSLSRDRTPDLYARALELEMISSPGDRFLYGPGQLYVFAEVLTRKLAAQGTDPLAYLEERILDPIGLELAAWERDDAGNPDVALGAILAAREWAKLGVLLKNRGSWRGREIVPAEAVAAVFEGSHASAEYGLTLWLNGDDGAAPDGSSDSPFYAGELADLALAAGLGNQRLYVIPSRDLVAVRFGDRDRRWRDREFLARLVDGGSE